MFRRSNIHAKTTPQKCLHDKFEDEEKRDTANVAAAVRYRKRNWRDAVNAVLWVRREIVRRFDRVDLDEWGTWKVRFNKHLEAEFADQGDNASRLAAGESQLKESLTISLLQQWLRDCDREHSCRSSQDSLPTRLIFVGSPDSSQLRLCETQTLKGSGDRNYIALSHCWGRPNPEDKDRFCTTKTNYDQRIQGFSIEDLPKTFQDAISVARAVGVSFLWIDAICIIQTDPAAPDSHWRKEAKRMEQVFSLAYFTLAATSTENWKAGFLQSLLERRSVQTHETHDDWQDLEPDTNDFKRNVDDGPLNHRAWVLQERVLSRRSVHFTKACVYWECGVAVHADDFRELRCGHGRDYFVHDPHFPDRLNQAGYFRAVDFVQFLFQQYAQAGITNESDREIAITSLTIRMQAVTDTECRYGVFTKFFSRLLLWRRKSTCMMQHRTNENPQIPSWSWMTSPHIEFHGVERIRIPPKSQLQFDPQQRDAILVHIRGFVDCSLQGEGRQQDIVDANYAHVGKCWFDTTDRTQLDYCVILALDASQAGQSISKFERIYFVLLVREQAEGVNYERIGLAQIKARYISGEYYPNRLI